MSLLCVGCGVRKKAADTDATDVELYDYVRVSDGEGKIITKSLHIAPETADRHGRVKLKTLEYPLTKDEARKPFYYFNDEWIPGADPYMVDPVSIAKMDIKDDKYGNRSIFITMAPELVDTLKQKVRDLYKNTFMEYDPTCEFQGGTSRMIEWLKENTQLPEGFKGTQRVVVKVTVMPDGTVEFNKLIRASDNEDINREAQRLIEAMPKFYVKYYTPIKEPLLLAIPITFQDPESRYIR